MSEARDELVALPREFLAKEVPLGAALTLPRHGIVGPITFE